MSLLEVFKDEVRKLPTTPPIFEIHTTSGGWQGTCLVLEPINKISHHDDVTDGLWTTDPIKALAMKCSRESIDSNSKGYAISIESSIYNLKAQIRIEIVNFVRYHTEAQSEIYQWYDRYATSENVLTRHYIEPLLGLIKYIRMNTIMDVLDEKHKQNAIGLLELIYQRDFRPEHVPQPRKRKRRRK